MSLQEVRPPAYSHDPESLELPSVPRQEPPSYESNTSVSLPDLRSLALPESRTLNTQSAAHRASQSDTNSSPVAISREWQMPTGAQNTSFPPVPLSALRNAADLEPMSPVTDVGSIMSIEEPSHRATSVSMDDPDVRIAAEALSGLGNPDFVRSPSLMSSNVSQQPGVFVNRAPQEALPQQQRQQQQRHQHNQLEPEPLLSLLTTSHPWLGGTINGSLSAYSSTKAHSPRFIQYGADFVERNIGSPVANTVGSVGRRTGVEDSLRRYLGGRRPSDLEGEDEGDRNKRRRVMDTDTDEMDVEKGLISHPQPERTSRRQSQNSFAESLPAYDENRSPMYEESGPVDARDQSQDRSQAPKTVSWSTQLMITTSGLGAALNEGSLQSLKFCLSLLRNATRHMGNVMRALRIVLDDYDRAMESNRNDGDEHQQTSPLTQEATGRGDTTTEQERDANRLAERIKALSDDIFRTLKNVVNSVSRYTGGALPENAGALVRRQLMSVPQRWRFASRSTAGSSQAGSEAVRGAHRMLAFAKEGLDMMGQVSSIVDCTIVSAEQWLDSLGRRKRREADQQAQVTGAKDQKMLDSSDRELSPRTTIEKAGL